MTSAVAAPPKARAKAVRFTFACAATEKCQGFVMTPDGNSSWKQANLPKVGESMTRPCAKCGADNTVERP
jgi:hypothetical protein